MIIVNLLLTSFVAILSVKASDEFAAPWHARIVSFVSIGDNTTFLGPCGGALIAPQWVLTTANCVSKANTSAFMAFIQLGKYDLRKSKEPGEETLRASEFHLNNGSLALIKLSRPVVLTNHVKPVQLPDSRDCSQNFRPTDSAVDRCASGTVASWSQSGLKNAKENLLKFSNFSIKSVRQCNRTSSGVISFCASSNNSGNCPTTSIGSPFVCQSSLKLIGLLNSPCSPEQPFALLLRTCSELAWIQSFNISSRHVIDEYPVRLFGDIRGDGSQGLVQVYFNNTWGSICGDRYLDRKAAKAICRQLNFGTAAVNFENVPSSYPLPPPQTPLWLRHIKCVGNETQLVDCDHAPFDNLHYDAESCNEIRRPFLNCRSRNVPPEEPGVDGQLRLVGGSNNYTGYVEVHYDGLWGAVCRFDETSAKVACRQLGFSNNAEPTILRYGIRGSSAKKSPLIWLDNARCQGEENALTDCALPPYGISGQCDTSNVMALVCPIPVPDGPQGQFRLFGGPSNMSGYLEVFWNGQWGTVCKDYFEAREARVACRSLGFQNTSLAKTIWSSTTILASNASRIWLDDVSCGGQEASLLDCRHAPMMGQVFCRGGNVALTCGKDELSSDYLVPVRLSGGTDASAGIIEVLYRGEWGVVCFSWDGAIPNRAATVVCRQLGFDPVFAVSVDDDVYIQNGSFNNSKIWLEAVNCEIDSPSLHQCEGTFTLGMAACSYRNFLAVSCKRPEMASDPGRNDDLRLIGGMTNETGYVQIYYSGVVLGGRARHTGWGAVCDDFFSDGAAQVVCRQLGVENVSNARVLTEKSGLTSIPPGMPFWLDDIRCSGNEASLQNCFRDQWGSSNCRPSEMVAVACNGYEPPTTTTASPPQTTEAQPISSTTTTTSTTSTTTEAKPLFYGMDEPHQEAIVSDNTRNIAIWIADAMPVGSRVRNCCTFRWPTALICAACLGRTSIATMLVASGVDLEGNDYEAGGTALIWASRGGHVDIVRMLITAGAQLDAQTRTFNDTALIMAAVEGHIDVVRLLVESGADTTLVQFEQMTAVQVARENGKTDVAEFLDNSYDEN